MFDRKKCFRAFAVLTAFLCGTGVMANDDFSKIDRNMAIPVVKSNGIAWYDALKAPCRVSGLAWFNKNGLMRRLPEDKRLPPNVDRLANNLTGATIGFRTDSRRVQFEVEFLDGYKCMLHFAPTGRSGLDLYCGGAGKWRTVGLFKIAYNKTKGRAELFRAETRKREMREFLLNLPLYNGVKSVRVGIMEKSKLLPPKPYANNKRIVIYGGSTVQGACASRPGRAYMNIIGRHFNMEVINLGFSGSSLLEPVMAEMTAAVERPAVVIIEGDRNAGLQRVKEREPGFIATVRKAHPDVPIVVMQGNPRWNRDHTRKLILAFQKEMVKKINDAGDRNVYLWDCSDFLGEDFTEASVDGLHPTDLGFHLMAERMIKLLTPLLK